MPIPPQFLNGSAATTKTHAANLKATHPPVKKKKGAKARKALSNQFEKTFEKKHGKKSDNPLAVAARRKLTEKRNAK